MDLYLELFMFKEIHTLPGIAATTTCGAASQSQQDIWHGEHSNR